MPDTQKKSGEISTIRGELLKSDFAGLNSNNQRSELLVGSSMLVLMQSDATITIGLLRSCYHRFGRGENIASTILDATARADML